MVTISDVDSTLNQIMVTLRAHFSASGTTLREHIESSKVNLGKTADIIIPIDWYRETFRLFNVQLTQHQLQDLQSRAQQALKTLQNIQLANQSVTRPIPPPSKPHWGIGVVVVIVLVVIGLWSHRN